MYRGAEAGRVDRGPMILADSSIWIDHFRSKNSRLVALVWQRLLFCHPAVVGEIACGNIADRDENLQLMQNLLQAPIAKDSDVLLFIGAHKLMGRGVGYIDMQLLASAAIVQGKLWTRDRRLKETAEGLGLSY
jgi:predicted nucleic acid-binding protein